MKKAMLNTIIILICITVVPECLSWYWPDSDPGPCTTAKEIVTSYYKRRKQSLPTEAHDCQLWSQKHLSICFWTEESTNMAPFDFCETMHWAKFTYGFKETSKVIFSE